MSKKIKLTTDQLEIIRETNDSVVVSANAGTGKTGVLVEKIKYEIKNNPTRKTIAGITFTIKAAKEIRDRLDIDENDIFIGTNNAFAIQEIISPFMWDVYGKLYKCDFDTNYSHKVNTFADGIKYLHEKKTVCSYFDSKHNFVFELALDILKKSKAAQLFLKSKYFKLFIDEYQDCDASMNALFMYIKNNLNIKLFIVGDEKQSIYMWRGAEPDLFKKLLNSPSFKVFHLSENFRCKKQIQNLSNLLYVETANLYKKSDDLDAVTLVLCKDFNLPEIINMLYDRSMKTAVLVRTKKVALSITEELNNLGNDFIYVPQLPIDDLTSKDSWIFKAIADYFFTKNIYNFFEYIPSEGLNKESVSSTDGNKIKKKLNKMFTLISNEVMFGKELEAFCKEFNCNYSTESASLLYLTLSDNTNKIAFSNISNRNQIMTLHASKGKEFEQVIVFAEDFELEKVEDKNLLYVGITRAKNKLFILTKSLQNSLITEFASIFKRENIKSKEVLTYRVIGRN